MTYTRNAGLSIAVCGEAGIFGVKGVGYAVDSTLQGWNRAKQPFSITFPPIGNLEEAHDLICLALEENLSTWSKPTHPCGEATMLTASPQCPQLLA